MSAEDQRVSNVNVNMRSVLELIAGFTIPRIFQSTIDQTWNPLHEMAQMSCTHRFAHRWRIEVEGEWSRKLDDQEAWISGQLGELRPHYTYIMPFEWEMDYVPLRAPCLCSQVAPGVKPRPVRYGALSLRGVNRWTTRPYLGRLGEVTLNRKRQSVFKSNLCCPM